MPLDTTFVSILKHDWSTEGLHAAHLSTAMRHFMHVELVRSFCALVWAEEPATA